MTRTLIAIAIALVPGAALAQQTRPLSFWRGVIAMEASDASP